MLALIFGLYAIASADRTTFIISSPQIATQFALSNTEIGSILSAFALGYGLFALPAGALVDRRGAKFALLFGLIIWSTGTFVNGFAGLALGAFAFLWVSRLVVGAAEAVVSPGGASILATWFPTRERGRATAIWNSANYLATAAAAPVMGWIVQEYHWPIVFWVMGVCGLIAAWAWTRLYHAPLRDLRLSNEEFAYIVAGGAMAQTSSASPAKTPRGQNSWRRWATQVRMLCAHPTLLVIFIGQYCGNTIGGMLFGWLPIYLTSEKGLSVLDAGWILSIGGLAAALATIIGGYVTDLIYRKSGSMALSRKVPLTVGYVLASFICLLHYVETTWVLIGFLILLFAGKGWANSGWILVADTAPRELIGTVGGMLNVVGALGSVVSVFVIGFVADRSGSFELPLLYVSAHGVLAIAAFWLILRKMERLENPIENTATPQSRCSEATTQPGPDQASPTTG